MRTSFFILLVALAAAGATPLHAVSETTALRLPNVEGAAHGFPLLRDNNGQKLADSEFAQWVENDRLQVKLTHDFGAGHRVEETARFRQTPGLIQEEWAWREFRGDQVEREFRVDFGSGEATAQKRSGPELKKWSKHVTIEAGRTFAGFGFTLAVECLRPGLLAGQKFELRAIGFTPQPRMATVEVSFAGMDHIAMAGRTIDGDSFVIHPKIPLVARPFVRAPDTHIWLIHAPPTGFLRWQGPLAEPDDALIQVDLLPAAPASNERPTVDGERR